MVENFANREVCDLIICDYATNKPVLRCDYANTTSYSIGGEPVFAYGGKGHPKRVTFPGEKIGTFKVETQLMSYQLFGLMTGAALSDTAKFIRREVLEAVDGVLTLPTEAIEKTVNVFAIDDDCGTLVQVGSISGKNITLTDTTSNAKYIVYYLEELAIKVKRLSITNTTFPKSVKIYADTIVKDTQDEINAYKMVVYKASPQPNFEMTMANTGDPSSITITFDMMADDDGNIMDKILMEN